MKLDLSVHRRLRERRLIRLVVTMAPVSNQVDEEILTEFHAIVDAELHDSHASVGVFGIHVNDWHFESLCEIARIVSRARIDRIGCKPDLIIRDDVEIAAYAISSQARHVEGFRNNTLARKRSVAVNCN